MSKNSIFSPTKVQSLFKKIEFFVKFNKHLPTSIKATAGGITKIPTNQSATAKLITKQLVTVRKRLVVSTDKITNVFPITVIYKTKNSVKV